MVKTIFQSFEAVARAHQGKPAISSANLQLSYQELAQKVDELAKALAEQGFGRGDRVAILLPNSAEFVIAAFAIWKVGAIFFPLHSKYKDTELLHYLADGAAAALVSNFSSEAYAQGIRKVAERAPSVRQLFLASERLDAWITTQPAIRGGTRTPTPSGDWFALTQYSTGSTGISKRVTRTHDQLLGELRALDQVMGFRPDDRVLAAVPLFHNYGFMSAMLRALLTGATLFTVSDFFTRDVAGLIERERITAFPAAPFMLELLAAYPEQADFSSLRYVLSAGAPLTRSLGQAFLARYGKLIWNSYGTTETGIVCVNQDPNKIDSVGRAIPGAHVEASPPDGVVGIEDPFAPLDYDNPVPGSESHFSGGRFFPGDLGRNDDDGTVWLTGRNRRFINVAGNKVDPGEVEIVLRSHPAVIEAAVLGVPYGEGGERVKAVLVTSRDCSREEMIAHCKDRVADFKCPGIIEFRAELPKSPLGKVLRKYLSEGT